MAEPALTAVCRFDPNHLTFYLSPLPPPPLFKKIFSAWNSPFFCNAYLASSCKFLIMLKNSSLFYDVANGFIQFYILQKLVFCKKVSLASIKLRPRNPSGEKTRHRGTCFGQV
ncbi:hypothetical protein MTO96_010487 [Rhipicephalus appendiculatus]